MPRYRKQEEHRIDLSEGDWLLVRKHLTAGEERSAQAAVVKTMRAGETPEIDYERLGFAQVASYMLDWSLTDADGKPIAVRDQPTDFIIAALRNMTPESSKEILDAIQAHDAAMVAEREQEKKRPAGVSAPSPTSTSAG